MSKFLKSLGNILTTAGAVLGLTALILRKYELSTAELLIILFCLSFVGFVILIIYQNIKTENRIDLIEENYKKLIELEDIRTEIKTLKLIIEGDIKKWIKKAN